jgi:hypothetical protein
MAGLPAKIWNQYVRMQDTSENHPTVPLGSIYLLVR